MAEEGKEVTIWHQYDLEANWGFGITGASDGHTLDVIVAPTEGTVAVSEGPGTESGEFCVSLSADLVESIVGLQLGNVADFDIAVPASGGTIQLALEWIVIDITVTPV